MDEKDKLEEAVRLVNEAIAKKTPGVRGNAGRR